MRQWPWLRQACVTIAYDNGMVNRFCLEDDAVDEMMVRAESTFDQHELQIVDHWLLYVPGDDLDMEGAWWRVCVPENDSAGFPVPDTVNDILNVAFGG